MKKTLINLFPILGALVIGFISISVANAVTQIYQPIPRYNSSLALPLSPTQTSTMSLVSGVDGNGTALNGAICFSVDTGNLSLVEDICGTASGTTVSNLSRGIDSTGFNSSTTLAKNHRVGANVQVTNSPYEVQYYELLNGLQGFPTPLSYDASVTTSTIGVNSNNFASVGYANGLSFSGVPNASTIIKGIIQIATTLQLELGTATGSTGAFLVVPASSTNQSPILTTIGAPTLTATSTGGGIASGTYYYALTQTNNYGQSSIGASTMITATSSGNTSAITLSWTGNNSAAYYSVYRSKTVSFTATSSFIASTTALVYTDVATNTLTAIPSVTMILASNTIPVTNASDTLADGFIGQSASDSYSFSGPVSMNALSLPTATGSLLSTTATGSISVVPAPPYGTGTVLTFNNGKWQPGLLTSFASSSLTINTTSNQTSTVMTLPIAGPNSVYFFSFNYAGTTAGGSSSTISLVNGNGSANLTSCTLTNGNTEGGALSGEIIMQNSTSSEFISALYTPQTVCTNSTSSLLNGYYSVNLGTSTSLVFGTKVNTVAGSGPILASSSVSMEQ